MRNKPRVQRFLIIGTSNGYSPLPRVTNSTADTVEVVPLWSPGKPYRRHTEATIIPQSKLEPSLEAGFWCPANTRRCQSAVVESCIRSSWVDWASLIVLSVYGLLALVISELAKIRLRNSAGGRCRNGIDPVT